MSDTPSQSLPIAGEAQFDALLFAGARFIDVRSQIEFERGTIPGAVNLPILDTGEREQVGICYKRRGEKAAIELGHSLVCGDLRRQRIEAWCAFAREHPGTHLFCWRGGLRSRLSAEWMREAGRPAVLIEGGYKALRNRLLREFAPPRPQEPVYIIGGRTGSAKTRLVNSLPGGVDLEGFARHRGSSFGRRVEEPPAQIDFENALALALLRQRHTRGLAPLFLEDESRQIGALAIPLELFQAMKRAPLAIVEMPLEFRVGQILHDYICKDLEDHLALDPCNGFELFAERLLASLLRIERRLGSERHRVALERMNAALARQRSQDDAEGHRDWIELLLREYYDPMYEYQLAKSAGRVVFRGDSEAVREWCLSRAQPAPEATADRMPR